MPDLIPLAGPAAAWATAYLAGACGPDDAAAGVRGQGLPHVVVLPGDEECGWSMALGRLRARGGVAAGLAVAAPGDIGGLPGPPAFNALALSAGECLLVDAPEPVGLVPVRLLDRVRWEAQAVPRCPVTAAPGAALRDLMSAMREGAEDLERLDLAAGRGRAEAHLRQAEDAVAGLVLPPTTSARAVELIALAVRLRAAVDAALADEGAAVSSMEVTARLAAVSPLARAWRRAMEAGFSARPQTSA